MLFYNAKFEEFNTLISNWKWSELKYGLYKEYISIKDVISYTNESFSNDVPYMEIIIQLLIADEEDVYEEFEYIEEISNLVSYMPCEDGLPLEDRLKRKDMVLTYIMIMGGIIYNYDEYSIADLPQRQDMTLEQLSIYMRQ